MIARSCRSQLYYFGSRNIRVAILFVVAIAILLTARDYIRLPNPWGIENGFPSPRGIDNGFTDPWGIKNGFPNPWGIDNGFPNPWGIDNGFPNPWGIDTSFPNPWDMDNGFPNPWDMDTGFPNPWGIDNGFPNPWGIDNGFPNPWDMDNGFHNPWGIDTSFPNPWGTDNEFPNLWGIDNGFPNLWGIDNGFPNPWANKMRKWNPAHNKDLFLVPGVRPKVHQAKPMDMTKILANVVQSDAKSLEHPLLAFQNPVNIQHSKENAATVEYISTKIKVEVGVITNLESNLTCWFHITLINTGKAAISYGKWEIYFHSIRFLQLEDFPYPSGILIKDTPLRLFHVQGSLYRLIPEDGLFHSWPAGSEITLHLEAKAYLIARSDFFPNWYVTAPKVTPVLIQSTTNENLAFVETFDSPSKWKRRTSDQYNPFTAEDRFNRNLVIRDLGHPGSHIVPTPFQVIIDPLKKVVIDTKTWVILQNPKFSKEISFLADLLKLEISSGKPSANYIEFLEDKLLPLRHTLSTLNEAYFVEVQSDSVTLAANDQPGAFYAAITLYSLTHRISKGSWEIPVCEILDQPRFTYRGLHLDVARNFQSKEEILRLLKVMSMYKLNKLHLHLSDDEGWRLEIPGLPELTEFGSKRCHGDKNKKCLFPQLGSGPEAVYPGTGYYTVNEYREILKYAALRHIQVIPEIDMPGHGQAAVVAMEARYHDYQEKGQGLQARKYLLSDLADKSVYLSAQSFTKSAINPCLESTYTFINHVMKALKVMHRDIQPLMLYHFGGDEVPNGAWVNSSACLSSSLQPDVGDPQKWKEYFVTRIARMAKQDDLELGVWEDGIVDHNTSEPYNQDMLGSMVGHIYTYPWNNKWESGTGNQAYRLANSGYKVVMSQGTHLYFDHTQEPDPEEVGLYWATRFIDLHHVFSFIPQQIYWNADISRYGNPLTKDEICNWGECLTLQQPENIVGMECHLWGELLRSRDITDHQMFPRVIAMAERAWHQAPWESESDAAARQTQMNADWLRFANTVGYKEYPYLDSLGIKYRIPPPGAVVNNKKLLVNSDAPGLEIQYSLDFGNTWQDARGGPELTGDATIFLRTMSTDKKRWSRIIKLQYDHDKVKVKQRAVDGQIQGPVQPEEDEHPQQLKAGSSQDQTGPKPQQQSAADQSQQYKRSTTSKPQTHTIQPEQEMAPKKSQEQILMEQFQQPIRKQIRQARSEKHIVQQNSQQQTGREKHIVQQNSQQQTGREKHIQGMRLDQIEKQTQQGHYQQPDNQGNSQRQNVIEKSKQFDFAQPKNPTKGHKTTVKSPYHLTVDTQPGQKMAPKKSQEQVLMEQFQQPIKKQIRQAESEKHIVQQDSQHQKAPLNSQQRKMSENLQQQKFSENSKQQKVFQKTGQDPVFKQEAPFKSLQRNIDDIARKQFSGKTLGKSKVKVEAKPANVRVIRQTRTMKFYSNKTILLINPTSSLSTSQDTMLRKP
ncbi:beta-hexosaminidase-like [Ylistrum balloti]|uniref:beta-hexosaminidase-like n=1 Tax=Ylistrum balloti TaxID=509963 RepID=UPI002905820D|nr:beta-hexosaminidase-like [Ylistrum balloti]